MADENCVLGPPHSGLRSYQTALIAEVQRSVCALCACERCAAGERHRLPFRLRPALSLASGAPREAGDDDDDDEGLSQSALLYLPTGGGKTRIAAALVRWVLGRGGRAAFIVNRAKLVAQARDAFLAEGIDADQIAFVAGGAPSDAGAAARPLVVATVQSMAARLRRARGKEASPTTPPSSLAGEAVLVAEAGEALPEAEESSDAESGDAPTNGAEGPPADAAGGGEFSAESIAFPVADLVIIDEAHGAVASSYRALLRFYRSGAGCSGAVLESAGHEGTLGRSAFRHSFVLGLTATPTRLDGDDQLATVFERLLRGPSVSQLVGLGVLVPPVPIRATSEDVQRTLQRVLLHAPGATPKGSVALDDSGAGNLDDDLGNGDASTRASSDLIAEVRAALDAKAALAHVVRVWRRYCLDGGGEAGEGRRTLVFAVDVSHSRSVVEAFLAAGISAAHVDGATPAPARDRIFEDVRAGRVSVLSSVGVISEGYDEPSVSCIVLLRPTASRGLYVQQVGRGLRCFLGKADCLVLDFVDNTLLHGPVTRPIVSVLDGIVDTEGARGRAASLAQPTRTWVCRDDQCRAIMHARHGCCVRCKAPFALAEPAPLPSASVLKPLIVPRAAALPAKPEAAGRRASSAAADDLDDLVSEIGGLSIKAKLPFGGGSLADSAKPPAGGGSLADSAKPPAGGGVGGAKVGAAAVVLKGGGASESLQTPAGSSDARIALGANDIHGGQSLFFAPGFAAACERFRLPNFCAVAVSRGRSPPTPWERDFLLSIAALISAGVPHRQKRGASLDGAEPTQKQRGILFEIVKKRA
jgi:superfamily II DNA or RNA helicase